MEPDKTIERLQTEMWDRTIPPLETLTTLEMLKVMNAGDQTVPLLVKEHLSEIAAAVDAISERLSQGGRMFYVGAGTSGRLGVLDAAECPPTFNTDPSMVQAIMAGGPDALVHAVEGAEDSMESGQQQIRLAGVQSRDVVVGLSASGRTPFVIGALKEGRLRGACTISVSANDEPEVKHLSDIVIAVPTGPEVIMGSTRLKAGTATKLVLNMLTTGAMVRLGKTFRNLMVDLKATNYKLIDRSRRIVMLALTVDYNEASRLLALCDEEVKTAIAVGLLGIDPSAARALLDRHHGALGDVVTGTETISGGR
ncbi:MAG: N-acetylmuramic acid 6-phosphate etherase [Sulfobacillus thermotolerans]|uniref:N-acetylmuramic acid 6-phosphate etherase n=1 Tax=Sulfobacillus thermotolerans TaxID=338644 RepID=A0ABM6RQF9_9FIRM|nr:N-acetylmuramic acid 6-phosphate etherase [Sulfobacillus thermotolerans]MCY0907078.1 N-acetylmuramic acid 6-phosphate etherase [Sulfobacillus thermotolerans]